MHPTRIFKTPEELYKAFEEYKGHLKNEAKNWPKVQYVGKDGDRKEDPRKLPLVMDGFEVFCYDKYGCIEQYFKNQDGLYDEFIPICSHIRKQIRANQITGGLLGDFNPSITQRLNGLKEQTETEIKGSLNIPNLPDIGSRK
jgi:hypothetical protein